jgi:hypothetical protein
MPKDVVGKRCKRVQGVGTTFIDVLDDMIDKCTVEELELHIVIGRRI